MRLSALSWALAPLLLTSIHALIIPQYPSSKSFTQSHFTQLPLDKYFNNRGAGVPGSSASLDGLGGAFPEYDLPISGWVSVGSIMYRLSTGGNDNIAAYGQVIDVAPHAYGALYLLVTASHGPAAGNITAVYSDGTSDKTQFVVSDWQTGGAYVAVRTSSIVSRSSVQHVPAYMYSLPVYVNPSKTLTKLSLPHCGPLSQGPVLHIFAAAARGASEGVDVSIANVAATANKVPDEHGTLWQMIEVDVHNSGVKRVQGSSIKVAAYGPGIKSRVTGDIEWLNPGERRTTYIGIQTSFSGKQKVATTLAVQGGNIAVIVMNIPLQLGIDPWEPTEVSLGHHRAPRWFDQDKFGIFIHWGLYSVPAWGPPGGMYSEWYWSNYNNKDDDTYRYHAQTWGEEFEYDDFLDLFKPQRFNPAAWLDLITASGANYFVLTAKHHEGIALWDTKVSNRSFVALGPKRDFVTELLSVAKDEYPNLKAGLYFSMPEWFNQAYPTWDSFGRAPRNPYSGTNVPYTGSPEFTDYVNQLQLPQLMELVDLDLDVKIIWCDIGGINNSTYFAAKFFNQAAARNQEVTINDRCGMAAKDFTTPEYSTLSTLSRDKWESTRGIDPHSFGYNQATQPDQYANASSLVQLLVDAVSKGGNLLLDMGPDAQGVVSEPQQNTLKGIGAWLAVNGDAIYNTTYWWVTSDEGDLRFTYAAQAFYITSFRRPHRRIQITSPIPLLDGDTIEHLGSPCPPLPWTRQADGTIVISVADECVHTVGNVEAWVFKTNWR